MCVCMYPFTDECWLTVSLYWDQCSVNFKDFLQVWTKYCNSSILPTCQTAQDITETCMLSGFKAPFQATKSIVNLSKNKAVTTPLLGPKRFPCKDLVRRWWTKVFLINQQHTHKYNIIIIMMWRMLVKHIRIYISMPGIRTK